MGVVTVIMIINVNYHRRHHLNRYVRRRHDFIVIMATLSSFIIVVVRQQAADEKVQEPTRIPRQPSTKSITGIRDVPRKTHLESCPLPLLSSVSSGTNLRDNVVVVIVVFVDARRS